MTTTLRLIALAAIERILAFLLISIMLFFSSPSTAADWSKTEVHLQYGSLERPTFAGGGSESTFIVTLQHASSWKYGDNFFFVDALESSDEEGFNDTDLYGEWYSNFSLGKILEHKVELGRLTDVGIILGVNYGADANVLKYLPGVRLSWDAPGFSFLNTNFMAYIDGNKGASSGGAPQEDDGFMFDVSWSYPLRYHGLDFTIEGHAEYLTALDNEFGQTSSWWILAQPQFRWHVNDKLAIGIEWQLWLNKLGDRGTDENAVHLLAVWKF